MKSFFTILQEVFNFFGSSLNRWRDLQMEGEQGLLTLKKFCSTRWTSRIHAVRAVRDRYVHILKVLTRISLTSEKTNERNTAANLRRNMDSFELVVFIVLWERILRAFDSSSREFQSPKINLSAACRLLNCTKNVLQYSRENWDSVLGTDTAISRSWNVNATFSAQNHAVRTRSTCSTNSVDPGYAFKVNVFYRTIDVALHELNTRFNIYIMFSYNSILSLKLKFKYLHVNCYFNVHVIGNIVI